MTTTQPTVTIPRPNTPWPEQGGRFITLCPGQNGQPDYALIVPEDPRALFVDVRWHEKRIDIPGACSDWDGLSNTIAMAEAGSELAAAIRNLEINGHRDLYLAAPHEHRLIKLFAPDLVVADWHWTSKQDSANGAWSQNFAGGTQGSYYKVLIGRARAVRRFLII